jgi:hypothetical protein
MPDIVTSTNGAPAGSHTHTFAQGGVDPMLAALLANNGGLGGNNQMSWLLPLLLLSGRGLFGAGWGGAGPVAAEAAVAGFGGIMRSPADFATMASVTSAKDAVAATNAAKDFLAAETNSLSKQLCCSTQEITEAINAITPQLFQGFAGVNQNIAQGFSTMGMAMCQNQAATVAAITQSYNGLTAQASTNAAAAALASCQTQNLIQSTACDIRQHITADGALTRALILQQDTDRLRAELTDAKAALNSANVSAKTQEQINASVATILAHLAPRGESGRGDR